MTWNWEHSDWPRFSWWQERLAKAEARFLVESGVLQGVFAHLAQPEQDDARLESLSVEALTTSRIEGELLDRESVRSSVARELGMKGDGRTSKPAERGISELMVALLRGWAAALDEATLHEWHRCLLLGRRDVRNVGCYRSGGVRVVSGPIYEPRVHFEAPPAQRVSGEMERFVDWFNRTGPDGPEALPALARAAVAHVYFVTIHPYEDGNGRIGRAIAEKALAQGLGHPSLAALSATILRRQREYYEALRATNYTLEIGDWVAWFAGVCIEAQRRTIANIEFIVAKTRLLDRVRGDLNERQEKALLRVLREGPDGFSGGLSAAKYISITGTSSATATRDLADMVDKGALVRNGERRHARYEPPIGVKGVAPVTIGESGEIEADRPD